MDQCSSSIFGLGVGPAGPLDLRVRRVANLPQPRGFVLIDDSTPGRRVWWKRAGATRAVLLEDTARLRVGPRGRLRVDLAPPLATLTPDLLNLGLALILAGRGCTILHGGAVARSGRCVALLGAPGAGKSTLVAAGAALGLEVVSDEIVPIRRRGREFLCPGSNPILRLDPALLADRSGAPKRRARGKIALDARRQGWRTAQGPQRLAGVVFLGVRLPAGPVPFDIERLPPAAGALGLLDNLYNRRVLNSVEMRRQLRVCSAAARNLPAYRLSVAEGLENVAAAARALSGILTAARDASVACTGRMPVRSARRPPPARHGPRRGHPVP